MYVNESSDQNVDLSLTRGILRIHDTCNRGGSRISEKEVQMGEGFALYILSYLSKISHEMNKLFHFQGISKNGGGGGGGVGRGGGSSIAPNLIWICH